MTWLSKCESENPGDNIIFENADRENNFEAEKGGHKNSVVLNHVDLNHINTDLNQSDNVDSNHADLNKDSSDIRELNKLLSWYGDSKYASDSKVSMITPLTYVLLIYTSHAPSTVH